jgi:hypothetical protein
MDVASTDSLYQGKRARQSSKSVTGPSTQVAVEPLYVAGTAIADVLADIEDGIALRLRSNPAPK